jgi:hypothetical protein
LSALYALEHVNALAIGERLTSNKVGVSVIYGDNSAGKSGYAASSGVPAARIDFQVGGQKRASCWTQGSSAAALLSAVSIFDSRTANVRVENTNDLAYRLPLSAGERSHEPEKICL